MGDGIGVEDLEKEINSVISALKLPDIWDMDDSHSDYESDSERIVAGVILFSTQSTKLELELSVETVKKLSKYKLLLN